MSISSRVQYPNLPRLQHGEVHHEVFGFYPIADTDDGDDDGGGGVPTATRPTYK